MTRKANHAVAANGITAKEFGDSVREAYQTGGATKTEAQQAGSAAYRSAKAGGAETKK
jgi:hypothetical protein